MQLSCASCARSFGASNSKDFTDLTLMSGGAAGRYTEGPRPTSTSLFQNPLISFVYERGWRQSFAWAGFPGADVEFDAAQAWLAPAARGGVLLDVSCGSGLFTRRFAASGAYGHVIGADYSAAMLREAKALMQQQPGGGGATSPITLVRADVGRLPFATASIDGIHAGAALHCWPSPSSALAEISRVLKPGGVLVATTFLDPTAPLGELIGDDAVLPLARALGAQRTPAGASYRWWSEPELRDLCAMVGLTGFERTRTRQFIMLRVAKPADASTRGL
jgi:ubiquinone/menaquinone biosynthesis C-methylase UbiE